MSKKSGFLLGLLLGGVTAVIAFKRLDPAKRQELINKVDHQATNLKNKAINYAFYASDAMNSASGQIHRGADEAKRHAGKLKNRVTDKFSHGSQNDVHYNNAADHLHSQLNQGSQSNDIVIDVTHNLQSGPSGETIVCNPDGSVRPF